MKRVKFLIDKIHNDALIASTCSIRIKQNNVTGKNFIKLKSPINTLTIQFLEDGEELGVLISDKISAKYIECTVCGKNIIDYLHFKIIDSDDYFYQLISTNATVVKYFNVSRNIDNILELSNANLDVLITRIPGIRVVYECDVGSVKYQKRQYFNHVHEMYRYIIYTIQQYTGVENG
jgi:hypothetical protein